jgi:hypothetical protein
MTSILHELHQNRVEARNAQRSFVVVSLKKDGTPRKPDWSDLQFSARRTREEAETRKSELERRNPGTSFAIVRL